MTSSPCRLSSSIRRFTRKEFAVSSRGVIGASWAAQYLARGFDVIATDPGPNAEANCGNTFRERDPRCARSASTKGASQERLSFTANMKEALITADFECGFLTGR